MGKDLERMCRVLNNKIPVVIAEGKRRPEVPMQAAKLASEGAEATYTNLHTLEGVPKR